MAPDRRGSLVGPGRPRSGLALSGRGSRRIGSSVGRIPRRLCRHPHRVAVAVPVQFRPRNSPPGPLLHRSTLARHPRSRGIGGTRPGTAYGLMGPDGPLGKRNCPLGLDFSHSYTLRASGQIRGRIRGPIPRRPDPTLLPASTPWRPRSGLLLSTVPMRSRTRKLR